MADTHSTPGQGQAGQSEAGSRLVELLRGSSQLVAAIGTIAAATVGALLYFAKNSELEAVRNELHWVSSQLRLTEQSSAQQQRISGIESATQLNDSAAVRAQNSYGRLDPHSAEARAMLDEQNRLAQYQAALSALLARETEELKATQEKLASLNCY